MWRGRTVVVRTYKAPQLIHKSTIPFVAHFCSQLIKEKIRGYDRYTLPYKPQTVQLANHPDLMSKVGQMDNEVALPQTRSDRANPAYIGFI